MLLTVQTQHLQEEKALIFTEDAKVREQSSRTSASEGGNPYGEHLSPHFVFLFLKTVSWGGGAAVWKALVAMD